VKILCENHIIFNLFLIFNLDCVCKRGFETMDHAPWGIHFCLCNFGGWSIHNYGFLGDLIILRKMSGSIGFGQVYVVKNIMVFLVHLLRHVCHVCCVSNLE
jgi:hypothetical protein